MRYRVLISLISLATMMTVATTFADPPAPAPAPAPAPIPTSPRVAIANPSRILNEMKETKDLLAKLEDARKQLQGAEQQKHDAITQMVERRNSSYLPENIKYREATAQIDDAMAQLQAWQATSRKSVEREQKWMVKTLYDKIEAAVGQVAVQNNIDLVITDGRQDIKNIEDLPYDGLRQILNTRNILFANKGVDISERVILLLDAQYAAAKK